MEINLEEYQVHEIFGLRYIILIGAWFVLVFRSSYWYQSLYGTYWRTTFKDKKHRRFQFYISKYSILFRCNCLFFCHFKIVSFISTTNQEVKGKKQIGSWLLLIRIGIITSGIILAFITAGFPLDRITIILSALGVGIGLGLQPLLITSSAVLF